MSSDAGWTWRKRVETISMAEPEWMADGTPACAASTCRHYDGKRCRLMGFRPESDCGPAVGAMAELLNSLELKERKP